MNNKNFFVALSIASLVFFNLISHSYPSSVFVLIGWIVFLYSLYKISTLNGENGWYAVFGLLNFVGLIIVLLIIKFKPKHQ